MLKNGEICSFEPGVQIGDERELIYYETHAGARRDVFLRLDARCDLPSVLGDICSPAGVEFN